MKNSPCVKILFSFLYLAALTLFSCSPLRTVGGSEIGNPTNARVIGTVVYPNGGGAATGADVRLRSKTFCKDTMQAALFKVTNINANTLTDERGRFVLDSVDIGDYFIEVNDGKSHGALIACSVNGESPVLTLSVDTATPTSTISGVIMAAKNGLSVYVQIFGLDRVVRANPASGRFELQDVPQGSYALRIICPSLPDDSLIKSNVHVQSGVGTNIGVIDLISFGGWGNSGKLLLNTTASGAAVTGTVTNFPVLVRLSKSNFDFSRSAPDGADLRFAKPDGAQLSYEIERFDPVAGLAEIWVKVDTVFGGDSTRYITMYWGASSGLAVSLSNGAAVFDTANGFQGVWHLSEAGNALAMDATINGYNGTPFNMTAALPVAGAIGNARNFDGSSSSIQMIGTATGKLNFNENDYYTISAWVNTDTLYSDTSAPRRDFTIVAKDNCQYTLKCFKGDFAFVQYMDNVGWATSMSPAMVATWKYVAGECIGSRQYLYVDGVLTADSVNFMETFTRPRYTASDVFIGKTPPGSNNWSPYFFKGVLDEVRISNIALSADWIKLCYMNQRADDKLVIFR
jgi:hypothetical protein